MTRNREIPQTGDSRIYYLPMRGILDEKQFKPYYALAFPAYLISAIFTSLRAFYNDRFEVVVGVFAFPQGLVAAIVSMLTRKPVLVSTDGGDVDVLLQNSVIRSICRILFSRVQVMTVETDQKGDQVRHLLRNEPILSSMWGVDTSRFEFIPFEKKIRWKAIAVSRYSKEKGLKMLLESLSIVAAFLRQAQFRMFLVGFGPEEEELREYVNQHSLADIVSITGRIPYVEIHEWYRDAALFILPSFREGLANALLEAMSSGCICLVSDIPSNEYVTAQGETGFLFKSGDSQDLAKQLKWIISHEPSLTLVTQAARKRVVESFSSEENAEMLRHLLNDLALSGKGQARVDVAVES